MRGGVWSWAERAAAAKLFRPIGWLLVLSLLWDGWITFALYLIHLHPFWEKKRERQSVLLLLIPKWFFQRLFVSLSTLVFKTYCCSRPWFFPSFLKRKPCMSFSTRRLIILPELSTGHCCCCLGLFLLFSSHLELHRGVNILQFLTSRQGLLHSNFQSTASFGHLGTLF